MASYRLPMVRFVVAAVVVLSLVLAACAPAAAPAPTAAPKPAAEPTKPAAAPAATQAPAPTAAPTAAKVYKVGISVIIEHPVLTQMQKGFQDRLKDLGYVEGKNIEYEVKYAQGEPTNASAIAKQFVATKKDLIVGNGTPAVQAAAKETKEIPIVFLGMTDPVAAGVAKSADKPGGNATGSTDWIPPEDHFKVLMEAFPKAKNVGTILNPSEANSKAWIDAANVAAKSAGLNLISVPVAGTGDVQAAAQSLVGRVDLIFIGADNTAAATVGVMAKVAISNKMPLATIFEPSADEGALLGMGVDYYKVGALAADHADKIFKGAKPGDLPVLKLPQLVISVNTRVAQVIGYQLPDSILQRARKTDK